MFCLHAVVMFLGYIYWHAVFRQYLLEALADERPGIPPLAQLRQDQMH